MTDTEFAALLRSRRTLTAEQVEAAERRRDVERGAYQPHEHRTSFGEARH